MRTYMYIAWGTNPDCQLVVGLGEQLKQDYNKVCTMNRKWCHMAFYHNFTLCLLFCSHMMPTLPQNFFPGLVVF